jgi:hypothetical protein
MHAAIYLNEDGTKNLCSPAEDTYLFPCHLIDGSGIIPQTINRESSGHEAYDSEETTKSKSRPLFTGGLFNANSWICCCKTVIVLNNIITVFCGLKNYSVCRQRNTDLKLFGERENYAKYFSLFFFGEKYWWLLAIAEFLLSEYCDEPYRPVAYQGYDG